MAGALTLAGFSSLRMPSVRSVAFRRRFGVAAAVRVAAAPAGVRGRSLYEVLEVRETATAREIKAAYRAMAKRVHPDVAASGSGAGDGDGVGTEEFLEIRRAYETLADPAARARYDVSIGRFGFDREVLGFGSRRWETDQCW
ncbi:chaperone protein dnaJ 11, chloroplastic-like [Typha latifolia]|uniref:chaperone protein dnaJ 11, chloroplastic-like n=1 Tax=Typha latifolia TaxID=4733 RepID=UPI003C2C2D1D